MKVGFIGLGGVGKPMAINIAKSGFDLTVTDLRKKPLEELAQYGARVAVNGPQPVIDLHSCLPNQNGRTKGKTEKMGHIF